MAENPGSSLVFLYQPFLAAVRKLRTAGLKVGRCFFLFKSFRTVNSMIFRDLGPKNIMIEINALGADWFLVYTCIFHLQLIQACPFPEAQVLHSFQMLFGYRLGVSLSNYNSGNEDKYGVPTKTIRLLFDWDRDTQGLGVWALDPQIPRDSKWEVRFWCLVEESLMFLLQVVPLKVYELSMWMAHFNHPTPKRTILVSNSEQIAVLHRGRLSRSQKPASFPTAVKYVDGAGRVRYKGTTQLKSTQCHDKSLVHFVCMFTVSIIVRHERTYIF